jgi:hypothetical protein
MHQFIVRALSSARWREVLKFANSANDVH